MTRHEPPVRTAVLPRHRPSGSVAPSAAGTLSMQAQRVAISTTRTQVSLGSGRLKTLIAPQTLHHSGHMLLNDEILKAVIR